MIGKFKDRIEDCQNARWYLLKHTVYTKGQFHFHTQYMCVPKSDESCSYCYDFCLPDYAVYFFIKIIYLPITIKVLRRQKYEDEISVGVRRLNCFR